MYLTLLIRLLMFDCYCKIFASSPRFRFHNLGTGTWEKDESLMILESGKSLTDRLRRILIDAKQLASQNGECWVRPEHLFLSIGHDGCANAMLNELNLSLSDLQRTFQPILHGEQKASNSAVFDDTCDAVFKSLKDFSKALRHNFLGSEHLLYGLVEVSSPVSSFLQAQGLTTLMVRETVLQLLGRGLEN